MLGAIFTITGELIFHVFDWQENSWGINFHGHGGVVDTIIIGFANMLVIVIVD